MVPCFRTLLAVALVGIVMLAGFGRGFATADGAASFGAPGVGAPICHAGSDQRLPGDPASHECCDSCVLLAPAMLAPPIAVAAPASTAPRQPHRRTGCHPAAHGAPAIPAPGARTASRSGLILRTF